MKCKWDFQCAFFQNTKPAIHKPFALSIPDDEHSETEERWLLLGKNLNEQMLLVVHTFRYDDDVRIISARKATATEAATYMKRLTK